jgi:hypothetical protein
MFEDGGPALDSAVGARGAVEVDGGVAGVGAAERDWAAAGSMAAVHTKAAQQAATASVAVLAGADLPSVIAVPPARWLALVDDKLSGAADRRVMAQR